MSTKIFEYKGEKFEMTENSIELFHAGSPILVKHRYLTKKYRLIYNFSELDSARNKLKEYQTAIEQTKSLCQQKEDKGLEFTKQSKELKKLELRQAEFIKLMNADKIIKKQIQDEEELTYDILFEMATDKSLVLLFLSKVLKTGNLDIIEKDYSTGNAEVLSFIMSIFIAFFLSTVKSRLRSAELKN